MSKKLKTLLIILGIVVLGIFIVLTFQKVEPTEKPILLVKEAKDCLDDSDCIVFGKFGDCGCGCFNRNYHNWSSSGICDCAPPDSCKCIDGVCEAY